MADNNMVTISKDEYNELIEAEKFLDALLNAGVDNWDGYGIAQEAVRG